MSHAPATIPDVSRQDRLGLPLNARHISKAFGETSVLSNLDLFVPAGQFLAIVGRSGCGKSTLLRLLADLDQPDAGEITLGHGVDRRVQTRVMFQEPRLLPWARVLPNVEVGLGADGRTPKGRERARLALASVGLGSRAQDWPSILSGGQRQRVALARALVSRPRLLALDEPLGALDALTRIEMQKLLEQAWLRLGFTAILVTHDVAEALTLADRIVMIEDGKISLDLCIDTPRPRRRGAVELARLEEQILSYLLREDAHEPDYVI